ncbi:hypothetical protein [Nocardia carnea]|nr:hypothetical protein [Nocardia carnea]
MREQFVDRVPHRGGSVGEVDDGVVGRPLRPQSMRASSAPSH